jgi:hypothetical protein
MKVNFVIRLALPSARAVQNEGFSDIGLTAALI